jgi:hypothetical protein
LSASEGWRWLPEPDALVAAPEYHALLFKNEGVLEARVPAAHTVAAYASVGRCEITNARSIRLA